MSLLLLSRYGAIVLTSVEQTVGLICYLSSIIEKKEGLRKDQKVPEEPATREA